MEQFTLLALVVVTSAAAWLVGHRTFGRRGQPPGSAALWVLEGIGTAVVFLVANVGLGMAVILAARLLGLPFLSLYPVTDSTLLLLAGLQGFAFHGWRMAR